jgi:hypothetical protein
MSCQLNLQCDAAILLQSDRIGADVDAIATQILPCPQIKRAIVKRAQDGCSTCSKLRKVEKAVLVRQPGSPVSGVNQTPSVRSSLG